MKFDMHCHTKEGSIDAVISIKDYIKKLKEQGIDGMLVTDHDSYKGYKKWLEIKDDIDDFTCLRGIEYDTKDAGHFLVIMPEGIELKVLTNRGMKLQDLIALVHHHGGILGPAHPFGARSSSAMLFKRMMKNPELIGEMDFLEGMNVCEKKMANDLAISLAKEQNIPALGGSDSHKSQYVGMGYTEFEEDIKNNDELIAYIKAGKPCHIRGKERTFIWSHNKRNTFFATYGFRSYNQIISFLISPLRKYRFKKTYKNHSNHIDP